MIEKTTADACQRCWKVMHREGMGSTLAGARWSLTDPDGAWQECEEQWAIEEVAERREEEQWMDMWAWRDKDDY